MMSRKFCILAAATTILACGEPAVPSDGVSLTRGEDSLRHSDGAAVLALSAEEVTAVELAKLAQHRLHNGPVLAHAIDQQEAHQALLKQLRRLAVQHGWHVTSTMSQSGATQWSALLQLSGARFADTYLRLQEPWRRDVLAHLQRVQQDAESPALQAFAEQAARQWEAEAEAARHLGS